jgi:hypothetical protein
MHRSGTSAATRVISFLGFQTPTEADLVPPSAKNRRGYWESMSLVAINTRVLAALGSDMSCPLVLAPGWEKDPRLESLRADALATFRRTYPAGPWVLKDPRNCLTFSFWHGLLNEPAAVMLVHRNPLEIAASSVRTRADERKVYALALWERYLREGLTQIAGRPVLVATYHELLARPAAWCARAHDFFASAGLPVQNAREDDVLSSLDSGLRHSELTREHVLEDDDVSTAQRELFLLLEGLDGGHPSFVTPPLPRETPTTDALFAERRARLELQQSLTRPGRGGRLRSLMRLRLGR